MSWFNPLAGSTSRRRLLGAGAAGAVGLAAYSVGMARLSQSDAGIALAQSAPWSGSAVPLGSLSSKQMALAARAFLNALGADQLSTVQHPDLSDAARTQWSNFPAGASPRPGIALGDLSESQRVLLHDLLRASTSSQGYHKMTGAIRADQVLHDLQGGDQLFGSANYYTTVYGSPEDSNWAWMLTGHHMSAIFTVSGDRTALTPMFTGAQPLMVPTGLDAGWQVLPQDASRASELLASLSSDQQPVAIIGTSAPGDVIAGPGRQSSLSTFQGIASGDLSDQQQRLLWILVQEFVRNADFDAAEAQLALVQQTWTDVHFAWQGPAPTADARYYFRVHGPRILIEYDVQEPMTSQGGHVHAITRDPTNDYGMDWLGLHYQESSAGPGGPGGAGGPGPGPGGPGGPGGRGGPPPGGAPPAP
jgi:Protein of unknown function (DUF3500)